MSKKHLLSYLKWKKQPITNQNSKISKKLIIFFLLKVTKKNMNPLKLNPNSKEQNALQFVNIIKEKNCYNKNFIV